MSQEEGFHFYFQCHRCGNCCRVGHGQIWVQPEEVEAMAGLLQMSMERFVQQHVRAVGSRWSLLEKPDGSCVMLDEALACRVYSARPAQCRSFPYWPQLQQPGKALRFAAGYCQGLQLFPTLDQWQAVLPRARAILEVEAKELVSTEQVFAAERWGSSVEIDLFLASQQAWTATSPPAAHKLRLQLQELAVAYGYPWSSGPWQRLLADRRQGWLARGGWPQLN